MENDIDINLIKNNDESYINTNNIFLLEYENQKIDKNNPRFNKWKNEMQKQYGTNAKLFKCIYDNLLFYESLEICKTLPFYLSTCPKCKHKICYFCSRDIEDQYERGQCTKKVIFF